jgi:hypothetical protein
MRIFHQVRGLLKFDGPESKPLRSVLSKYLTGLAQVLALHPASRAHRGVTDLDVAKLLFGAISGVTSVRASLDDRLADRSATRPTLRALLGLVRGFESPGGVAAPARMGPPEGTARSGVGRESGRRRSSTRASGSPRTRHQGGQG